MLEINEKIQTITTTEAVNDMLYIIFLIKCKFIKGSDMNVCLINLISKPINIQGKGNQQLMYTTCLHTAGSTPQNNHAQ